MKWTEALVLDAIRATYLAPDGPQMTEEWAMLTQVPLRCLRPSGEAALAAGRKLHAQDVEERTIDAFVVRCLASEHGFERLAIEVKVSAADYRSETDAKRAPAEASAHRCAYAAPAGLIDPATLPTGWGLIEVSETAPRTVWRRRAVRRVPTCDLDYLASAGFRRASRAEESIRAGDVPAAEVARLRDENDKLTGMLRRAKAAVLREEQRAKLARSELLGLDGAQECADCGGAVTWKRGGPTDSTWTHVDRGQEGRCYEARAEADRLRREARTGAAYSWGFASSVEPKVFRNHRLAAERMETAS
jgi:hypothetical protein